MTLGHVIYKSVVLSVTVSFGGRLLRVKGGRFRCWICRECDLRSLIATRLFKMAEFCSDGQSVLLNWRWLRIRRPKSSGKREMESWHVGWKCITIWGQRVSSRRSTSLLSPLQLRMLVWWQVGRHKLNIHPKEMFVEWYTWMNRRRGKWRTR